MRPRPGRTSPRTCQGYMGCRPVGRERQDAGHTARSCFVWPNEAFEMAPKVLAGIVNLGRTEPRNLDDFSDVIWINSRSGQRQYPFSPQSRQSKKPNRFIVISINM